MDSNQDGKISKEEYINIRLESAKKIGEARFDQLDANKDGKITKDEFMAVVMEKERKISELKFKAMDINKDGMLTEEEISRALHMRKRGQESRRQQKCFSFSEKDRFSSVTI